MLLYYTTNLLYIIIEKRFNKKTEQSLDNSCVDCVSYIGTLFICIKLYD